MNRTGGTGSVAGTTKSSGPAHKASDMGGVAVTRRFVGADRIMAQPVDGWDTCVERCRRSPEYDQLCSLLAGADAVPPDFPHVFVSPRPDPNDPPYIVGGRTALVAMADKLDKKRLPVLEVDIQDVPRVQALIAAAPSPSPSSVDERDEEEALIWNVHRHYDDD